MLSSVTRRDTPKTINIQHLHSIIDPISNHNEKTFAAAQWYGENGIHIVPFIDYGGGKMGYPKGVSQRTASASAKLIKKWWHPKTGLYPGEAICMAHGGQSGFCAIDLDVKKTDTIVVDGIGTLTDLIYAYGEYSDGSSPLDTLMATTPSGGKHLIFQYHPEIISNSEISYPGIDTRGGLKRNPSENGGITFVEPSVKPNSKNKNAYRWDENFACVIDMPVWLVDVLNGRPPKRGGIRLQDEYLESAPGLHGDGRDRNIYIDLLRFVGIGYTEEQLWELLPQILERMDPPDEGMVKAKIRSVLQSEAFLNQSEKTERKEKADSLDLETNKNGTPIQSLYNLLAIIRSPVFQHGYGDVRYDDFYHNYTRDGRPLAEGPDWATSVSRWIVENFNIGWSSGLLREHIESICYGDKPHVNAASDYMLKCPRPDTRLVGNEIEKNYWGSGRNGPGPAFEQLCVSVMDLDNPDLHPEYTKRHKSAYKAFLWFWMQGIVSRACVPGCKMEIMLNMFGGQGIGKSLFFRDLCPDKTWFTDSVQDTIVSGRDNKDELTKLQSKLIVELPELSPIKRGGKAGDDKMKQFISTQVDYFRKPYGIDTVPHPRTCALCGSSNNNDVYRDITGDRRFVSINHGDVPFKLGDINNGVMDDIRSSVWGEVVASFKEGELNMDSNTLLVCIPPNLREYQSFINSSHKYEEVGIPELIDWMEQRTRITWNEVVAAAKEIPGLRDAKESAIMATLRPHLKNSTHWEFKKRNKRGKVDGSGTETKNMWVNTKHAQEDGAGAGVAVPVHWQVWIEEQSDEKPEY